MVSCVVCGTSKSVKTKNVENPVTFHVFPKNPIQRDVWIKFVDKINWQPTSRSLLCSKHFTADCFDKSFPSGVRLKPNSIPTIHIQRMKYVRNYNEEISLPTESLSMLSAPSTSAECSFVEDETRPVTPTNIPNVSFTPSGDDSPRKVALKRVLQELCVKDELKNKKIRQLQKENWRLKKKIENLNEVIDELKNQNLIEEEMAEVLINKFGRNKDLFKRIFYRSTGKSLPKKYSEDIRTFALTLHFFSPKAYNYVRDTMDSCLPHTKTLSKWYSNINANPGFTSEALEMLKLKSSHSQKLVICSLVMDEMAIRKEVEWDGEKYIGFVTFGSNLQDPAVGEATQALVFMVVSINEAWKVPVGYFFIHSITSTQKVELIKQCLHTLANCNVIITNLTFDGAPTNFTMSKQLGCSLDVNNLNTELIIDNNSLYVLPDPSHMIKLIRNLFGDFKILFNSEQKKIDFNYLIKLNELQKSEGLHLANKLRQQHIMFFKQKMRTKLATQLLSRSVAEALLFCKNVLKLEEFSDCAATAEFIFTMNDAFDILNSRKITGFGYKQAVCEANISKIKDFSDFFSNYVKCIKLANGTLAIDSNRKTGFLGMIMGLESIQLIYKKIVAEKQLLKFIPVYKLSQDHIELFFGTIRSHGGHNDNPTCRQFTSAYKKILIHAEVRDQGMGNCIPLDQINILQCSSSKNKKSSEELINEENIIYNQIDIPDFNEALIDHDYVFGSRLTEYSEQIVIYIAGFVVTKVSTKIKCEGCLSQLMGTNKNLLNSFLHFKNKGALTYPSQSVIKVCNEVEKIIRIYSHHDRILDNTIKKKIEMETITRLISSDIFSEINKSHENLNFVRNHAVLLMKSIIQHYLNVRLHYICKQLSIKDSIRNYYKKLILFKGQ